MISLPHRPSLLRWSIMVKLLPLGLLLTCCFLCTTLQSTAWAKPERVIRIGAFNFYPAIFQDTDGKVKGFYVDALNQLADRENLRIEYVYGSWADGLQRVQSGEVDVLTSVAYTEERARFLDYSKTPLLTVWGELYVPLVSEIDNITTMQGKTVAVMKNDFNGRSFIERARKFGISCNYIEFSGFKEVFEAVAKKKVDAGVVNNTYGASKQGKYGLRSTGIVFNPFDIHFAVAKDKNSELLALLESYLYRWRHEKNSVYLQARLHWEHGALEKVPVTPKWLLVLLMALGAATLLAAAFIMLLRSQIARATEAIGQREASLRESATMKRLLLNSAAEGLLGLDLDGICTFCNKASLKILGYEREDQVVGRNINDLIHHSRDNGSQAALSDCKILQPNPSDQEHHGEDEFFWRADGSFFPVEYWSRPIHRDECHIGSVLTFVDISERKKLVESYRFICRSGYEDPIEDFFPALTRHLTESLSLDLVYVGRLQREKQIAETIACYKDGESADNFPYSIKETPCAETLDRSICCYPQGVRESFPQASLLAKFSAESYVGATLFGFDGQPIGLIAGIGRRPLMNVPMAESILKLVSLRAAGELERQQATLALELKNKEIERFTYAVSHDLKSPLVTIMAFLDYLRQDIASGSVEAIEKDLSFIQGAAEKMSMLLEDLLRMSRIGRLENVPSEVPFAALVEDALLAVAGAIKKRRIEVQVDTEIATLCGDRQRLAEIWQNLIDNAVKFMGDQISPLIEIGIKAEQGERVFFVRDNGIGIDPKHSHKVFGLFEKLDPASPGTGLGLALVKKIVEHYRGSIWVESAGPGHGSCFLFTLPEVFNQQGDIAK
jgi:PAS domain S-box-containing protein